MATTAARIAPRPHPEGAIRASARNRVETTSGAAGVGAPAARYARRRATASKPGRRRRHFRERHDMSIHASVVRAGSRSTSAALSGATRHVDPRICRLVLEVGRRRRHFSGATRRLSRSTLAGMAMGHDARRGSQQATWVSIAFLLALGVVAAGPADAQDSRLDLAVGMGFLVSSSEARFRTQDVGLAAWLTEHWGVGAGYSRQHRIDGPGDDLGEVLVTEYTLTVRYRRRLFGDHTMLHAAAAGGPLVWWTRRDDRERRTEPAEGLVLEFFLHHELSSRFGVRSGVRGLVGEGFTQYMAFGVLTLW